LQDKGAACKKEGLMIKARILHLITHLGVGGAQDNTLLTVEGLSREHYEVHLAAGQDYVDWEERARGCSDAFFTFPTLRHPIHPLNDMQALYRIKDFIQEHNYHIVHTHSSKAGILGRIAARWAGVPIVVHTIHGFPWHDYMALWRRRLYILSERYTASLSDALITVSDLNKQEALNLKLAPPAKFTTIYSGIDLSAFDLKVDRSEKCLALGLDPDSPVVGTVGRLSKQKAPSDFVAAAKQVLTYLPESQFIMVGDGPLVEEVRRAIGDEQRIKMLGFRADVPEILSILDVFALSSRWEGLGRALTEAMIMGLPVAATSVNGVPEIVTHGETGLLSAPEAPMELAQNIRWLLEHPDEAARIGQRARKRVVPAFSARRMVERIEALYEQLLIQKGDCEKLVPD
jgi:glycosyltransferase involved in cell wall biosynthesis